MQGLRAVSLGFSAELLEVQLLPSSCNQVGELTVLSAHLNPDFANTLLTCLDVTAATTGKASDSQLLV
jgi:hypothetical protein